MFSRLSSPCPRYCSYYTLPDPLICVETELLKPSLNKRRIQKEAIPWMGERVSWLVLTYAVHLTLFVNDEFLFCKRVQTYANENILLAIEITLLAWLRRPDPPKKRVLGTNWPCTWQLPVEETLLLHSILNCLAS